MKTCQNQKWLNWVNSRELLLLLIYKLQNYKKFNCVIIQNSLFCNQLCLNSWHFLWFLDVLKVFFVVLIFFSDRLGLNATFLCARKGVLLPRFCWADWDLNWRHFALDRRSLKPLVSSSQVLEVKVIKRKTVSSRFIKSVIVSSTNLRIKRICHFLVSSKKTKKRISQFAAKERLW